MEVKCQLKMMGAATEEGGAKEAGGREGGRTHSGYLHNGLLCDLLVYDEACCTLEECDGLTQVPLRHLHQRCYTLKREGGTAMEASAYLHIYQQYLFHGPT